MNCLTDGMASGRGRRGTPPGVGYLLLHASLALGLIGLSDLVRAERTVAGTSMVESRVDRIRDRLVDRAIEAPVRISSSAWLDESGQFRHVTRLYSEIRSRALADLGIDLDGPGAEKAVNGSVPSEALQRASVSGTEASTSIPSKSSPGGDGGSGECSRTPDGLRRFARIQVGLRPHDGPHGLDPLNRIARIATDKLLQKAMDQGSLQPTLLDGDPASSYDHRLISDGRFDIPYRIDIEIRSAGPLETSLRPGAFLSMREISIQLALVERASGRSLLMRQESIILPGPRPEVGRSISPTDSDSLVAGFVDRWYQDAQSIVLCEPMRVAGRSDGQRVISIPVGARAGVRVGDRWLLLDPARIPERALEPGALKGVQLAEVISVGQYRSSLRLEASEGKAPEASPPDRGAQWIAVPL